MDSRGSSRLLEEPLPPTTPPPKQSLFTTGDVPVTSRGPIQRESRPRDKRSLDYILRSGLAGGLAGCAVRVTHDGSWRQQMLTCGIGQNGCRTSRPRQDFVSSVQPTIRQIYRQLVWRLHRDAGHQYHRRAAWSIPWTFCHSPQDLSICWDQVSGL
jgi:hypothetical protein